MSTPLTLVYNILSDNITLTLPIHDDGIGTGTITSIDWGDDSTMSLSLVSHTYAVAGSYEVLIFGTGFTHLDNTGNSCAQYLTDCTDFGTIGLTNLTRAFSGAITLTSVPASLPASITILAYAFEGAQVFNHSNITSWDTSNVLTMDSMFAGAGAFNQNIGSWNVANVANFSYMFSNCIAFNHDLGDWVLSGTGNYGLVDCSYMFFGCVAFNNGDSAGASTKPLFTSQDTTGTITNFSGMFKGAQVFNQDISTWIYSYMTDATNFLSGAVSFSITNYNNLLIALAANTGAPNNIPFTNTGLIYHGTDAVDARNTLLNTYTWTIGGDVLISQNPLVQNASFTVTVSGSTAALSGATPPLLPVIGHDLAMKTKDSGIISPSVNYTSSAGIDTLVITNVVIPTSGLLLDLVIADVDDSNTSVLNLNRLQVQAEPSPIIFTLDLPTAGLTITLPFASGDSSNTLTSVIWGDSGDTTNDLTSYSHTYSAGVTGSVTIQVLGTFPAFAVSPTAWQYLTSITSFGSIGLTTLASAFSGVTQAFTLPNSLPTTVTSLNGTFENASGFNDSNIAYWNTTNVTNFASILKGAASFNLSIDSWNTSNATTFYQAFYGATTFNNALNSWNTTNVTNMAGMFKGATAFNQSLNSWNVSNVSDFTEMFYQAQAFNQPLNSWILGTCNLNYMFNSATAFNQDLSSWSFTNVTAMDNMVKSSALSIANYNKLLIRLASQTLAISGSLQPNSGLVYTSAAAAAHTSLLSSPKSFLLGQDLQIPSNTVSKNSVFTAILTGSTSVLSAAGFITDGNQYALYQDSNKVSDTITFTAGSSGIDTLTLTNVNLPTIGSVQLILKDETANTPVSTYRVEVVIGPRTPCFLEGSQILCSIDDKETYLPIEQMKPGTLVKTLLNGYKKVVLIGKGSIENPGTNERLKNRLYTCSTANYPELTNDLVLTGCHSILVEEITDKQRAETMRLLGRMFATDDKYRLMACVDERAEPLTTEGAYTIWHFALENDDQFMNYGVFANGGLLVETCSQRNMRNNSNLVIQ